MTCALDNCRWGWGLSCAVHCWVFSILVFAHEMPIVTHPSSGIKMSPEHCQRCSAGKTAPVRTQLQQPLLHKEKCFHLVSQSRPRPQQPGVARKVAAAVRPPCAEPRERSLGEVGTESPGKKKEWQSRSRRSKHTQRSQSVVRQTCSTTVHRGHAAQPGPAPPAPKRTPSRSIANGKAPSLAGLLHITACPPLWLRRPRSPVEAPPRWVPPVQGAHGSQSIVLRTTVCLKRKQDSIYLKPRGGSYDSQHAMV